MRELVADGADARVERAHGAPVFGRGGGLGNGEPVGSHHADAGVGAGQQVAPFVEQRGGTGIDVENLVYAAVAVPVVWVEVAPCLVVHHHRGGLFGLGFFIAELALGAGADLIGAHDVEMEVQLAVRLVAEIVGHGASAVAFLAFVEVVGEMVEQIVVEFQVVRGLEFRVAELHQHHQLPVGLGGVPIRMYGAQLPLHRMMVSVARRFGVAYASHAVHGLGRCHQRQQHHAQKSDMSVVYSQNISIKRHLPGLPLSTTPSPSFPRRGSR